MSDTGSVTTAPPARAAEFNAIDEFGSTIGWDLDFRQLDSGPTRIQTKTVTSELASISQLCFDRDYHQRGCPPAGMCTFGFSIHGTEHWSGQVVDTPVILNLNQSSGFDAVSRAGFRAFTFSVDRDWLEQMAETFQLQSEMQTIQSRTDLIPLSNESAAQLENLFLHLLSSQHFEIDEEHLTELSAQLLRFSGPSSNTLISVRCQNRTTVLTRALDYIEDNRLDSPSVRGLCEETGIPARTLTRIFQERFGVGPKVYIRLRRLEGVRQELRGSTKTCLIADVANAWGFWHMGRFAQDYRAMFGELPSETS